MGKSGSKWKIQHIHRTQTTHDRQTIRLTHTIVPRAREHRGGRA